MRASCLARSGLFTLALSFILPFLANAQVWNSVPDAELSDLGLTRAATPDQLYKALSKRYAEQYTKGKLAKWWEPIPMDAYFAPTLFYKAPDLDLAVKRGDCVNCHTGVTHGWVLSWQKSVHANLDEIRALPDSDVRAYKKGMISEVEANLVSEGFLKSGDKLEQVSCIDCHLGVGKAAGNHKQIHMPDRAACGACHLRQFAEAESERDTQKWPQKQWPDGHPSHAVDYMANVELATWAATPQREVVAGCTLCHTNEPKCDTCHTRHTFSTVEARKPQACATCHNGVDHPEFEDYMLSKHGTVYQTQGDSWNWNARLADALTKGDYTAPTCAFCHFENGRGEFTHNVTYKVRWAFLPQKDIADNIHDPWFEHRKQQWQATCANCHSPRFASTYLDFMDKGIAEGTNFVEQNRKVVQKLYDDKLLVGQKTNRPAPAAPDKDEAGGFYSLFTSNGNNPTMVDRVFTELWEQHVADLMKAYEHVNPGGWSYTQGWSEMVKDQTFINEQDTKLREEAKLEQRVASLEAKAGSSGHASAYDNRAAGGFADRVTSDPRTAAAGIGLIGGALLLGGLASLRRRRRDDDA
ncbi:MAG: multiheme c-type cytochrome [Lysobacterales bacterium]